MPAWEEPILFACERGSHRWNAPQLAIYPGDLEQGFRSRLRAFLDMDRKMNRLIYRRSRWRDDNAGLYGRRSE